MCLPACNTYAYIDKYAAVTVRGNSAGFDPDTH